MGEAYILTVDQSTSGTKVMIVNQLGQVVDRINQLHQQLYPKKDWVEHDPMDIYHNVKSLINQLVEKHHEKTFEVLSITNQRETIVLWDKHTGKPVYPAIVWQCKRTTDLCIQLKAAGYEQTVADKTGLTIDPYFSASKIKWIIDHVDGVREKIANGDILVGTMDSWLIWKLTNGTIHATDYSNASRTLLFNIYTLEWDDELLSIFNVPKQSLPSVYASDHIFGEVTDKDVAISGLRISGIIGDSQGALFGQQCFEKGMAKATYGTGTSVLVFTKDAYKGKDGMVTSLAWGIGDEVEYAIEGIINSTGDVINWLRDELGLIQQASETEELAYSLTDNEGVYLVPAFIGLGAPYWSPNTRAAIIGMNRNTSKAHIARAALESIAFQVRDTVSSVEERYPIEIKELCVDGGATKNTFLMEFQANILNKNVRVSNVEELSALGSAYLAGIGMGIWSSKEELASLSNEGKQYMPTMPEESIDKYIHGWKSAIQTIIVDD